MALQATAALLLVAAMARSALPPFSGWLLGSRIAPIPVAALMNAGVVHASGMLLIRFAQVIEAAPVVQLLAVAAGVAAALWSTRILLVRPDVRVGLAGSRVARSGFMVLTCGLGVDDAATWHLIAQRLLKAWLFLGSGSAIGGRRVGVEPPGAVIVTMVAAGLVTAVAGTLLAPCSPAAGLRRSRCRCRWPSPRSSPPRPGWFAHRVSAKWR